MALLLATAIVRLQPRGTVSTHGLYSVFFCFFVFRHFNIWLFEHLTPSYAPSSQKIVVLCPH